MDDPSTTTATLDKADEEILTYTVSDEALEAAGTERPETRSIALVDCITAWNGCVGTG
jgi:hypothetical protein